MTHGLPRLVAPAKQLLARAVSATLPQCRFERALFVLGHMRCGSTALSQVLGHHPEISGYGEAHVAYRSRAGLGQLVLGQARRQSWKPGARYLHDKILHDRYDCAVPDSFYRARAIFLVRAAEPAIRSIRHLFRTIGSSEYATDGLAAEYYEERLQRLATMWHRFPRDRRIGFDFAELTAEPETVLARLSGFLGLATPLANAYRPVARLRHGAGDPLTSPRNSAIVARAAVAADRPRSAPLALSRARLASLEQLHREVCRLIGTEGTIRPAPPGLATAGSDEAIYSSIFAR